MQIKQGILLGWIMWKREGYGEEEGPKIPC